MELSGYIGEQFRRAASDPQDDLVNVLATVCASGELAETTALMMITLFSARRRVDRVVERSSGW